MFPYLVFVGALVVLAASALYARDTLRGDAQPNRVTWLLWALAPLIGAAAAFAEGAGWAAVPTFTAGLAALLVFAASFMNPKAYWKLGTFDYLCGACSLLALVLWAVTRDPVTALILAILGDALAALPTLAKAWKQPASESASVYWAGLVNALTAFAAVRDWTFPEYGFAVYLALVSGIFLAALYRPRAT